MLPGYFRMLIGKPGCYILNILVAATACIKEMVTPGGPFLDPSKLNDVLALVALWVNGALGDILSSIVSNSHFRKRPVARDMTIFGSHILPHVTGNVFTYS